MNFITLTKLQGVVLINPPRFGDSRGFFSESWNRQKMLAHDIDFDFVQDNHSVSAAVNTVRGLHYQSPPSAQAKLVRCGRGALFDVAVDVRSGSPTFGQWVGYELSAENGLQLLIPEGFLHGFATRMPDTEIIYKCSDYYAPDCDGAVRFDDPDLGIDWGLSGPAVLSEKDEKAQWMTNFESPFVAQDVS
ncbi:dTDP-4-dehydrorhamnose 3,5-epimerase [Octadecabacter ascidiaceicola]|uniref:dTDP-4-dehydrorhamnose 3,5-epimerase n=1 Tax=Octadecabacter ascidiaceicola TaxID=1655543 RepID=A0A238KSZ0_9RHOB|nr:dTDP-4-dehydrorhamnose 3,5-epimerase [Octadecabacter ascidiaceicola]SMX45232.1 dTDP-4-dehydrorhamnose 3,5-epimerase [Octadecabacter ascidiaceicola]